MQPVMQAQAVGTLVPKFANIVEVSQNMQVLQSLKQLQQSMNQSQNPLMNVETCVTTINSCVTANQNRCLPYPALWN